MQTFVQSRTKYFRSIALIMCIFDKIDHDWLIKFFEQDIADKNFIRYIKRFLIGGIMEDGKKLVED